MAYVPVNIKVSFNNEIYELKDQYSILRIDSGTRLFIEKRGNALATGWIAVATVDFGSIDNHGKAKPKIISCNWVEGD